MILLTRRKADANMAWRYSAPGGFQINRVKGWYRRRNIKSLNTPQLVALGLVSFAIVAGLLWKVPEWQVPSGVTVPIERAQLENEFRRTAAQIALSLGLLGTLFVGWRRVRATERTVEVAQEGQITERFTRAIEQLGNDKSTAIRLGGIYALERIAKDSAKDHWQVMEVLTAYVRENARWEGDVDEQGVPVSDYSTYHRIPTDIQAILTVLGRRNVTSEGPDQTLDLGESDLRSTHFENIDARFASFFKTNLRNATFIDANLQLATFLFTNLENTHFMISNLDGSALSYSNLRRAILAHQTLRGADLQYCDLENANIEDADLCGANLAKARGLTQEQIDSAITDETTILPDYLKRAEPSS